MNKNALLGGIKNIPNDGDWRKLEYYFHYSLTEKDRGKLVKKWVKKNYSKAEAEKILACPERKFTMMSLIAAATHYMSQGYVFEQEAQIKKHFNNLIDQGDSILAERKQAQDLSNKKVYSPRERLVQKINSTVIFDIETLEERWSQGETPDFKIIDCMKIHDLKPMAIPYIVSYIEDIRKEYEDAHSGACKQAKEAYSHLGKRELTKRIKCLKKMVDDLDKFKNTKRKSK